MQAKLPKSIPVTTKIGQNIAIKAKKYIKELGFNLENALLVSDETIFQNCKEFFNQDIKNLEKLILKTPKADLETAKLIEEKAKNHELIIAIGSGTINDLCKYASLESKIPYVIFASAASMNGYLSKNSSLIVNDHKKTLPATLPKAVFCDLAILKNAPLAMTKAGIGDSMCFYGCWFDWLLSHLFLGTDFNGESFDILCEKMNFFVQNYQKFDIKDEDFLNLLIEILLLSGASMTLAGSSCPASQSEHLIAHAFTMKYPQNKLLHGTHIATTCLTTAKIQEELLSREFVELRNTDFENEMLVQNFGEQIASECKKEYLQKAKLIEKNRKFLQEELAQNWSKYCNILSRIIVPEQNLRDIFKHFGVEVGAKALGIENGEYFKLVGCARFIRNRFTCLDI